MNTESSETITIGTWGRLGKRTYWLFLGKRLEVPFSFLILAVLATIGRSFTTLHPSVLAFLGLAGAVCILIFVISLIIIAVWAWVLYRSYGYFVGDDAIKISQGVFTKQEVAIPYRQIQNVEIERTLSNRFIGLSKVVILTAGHDEERHPGFDESAGILPAMDKHIAEALQTELLKRAEVQKVIEANPKP